MERPEIDLFREDAIVNMASEDFEPGTGLSGAIHLEAGPELAGACRAIGRLPIGEAVLTPGFGLPAGYVLHAACPKYGVDDPALLAKCYRGCLELCRENGIHTIAFPPLSTGKLQFPKTLAARTAVETVAGWLADDLNRHIEVTFSCVDLRLFELFTLELKKLEEENEHGA